MTRIRRVLLLGHTHHDVGYTNSPRIVDPLHVQIVRHVIELAEQHGGDGPDAFRWTFEVARPVIGFLRRASPDEVQRLRRLVEEGRLAVTGGYLNMTQLPSAADFDAGYELLGELGAAGLPVRTEQHGDVNGIAWGAVDGMRRAGIRRLIMALNPDHGRAPLTQPSAFWWRGAAGERVFTFLSTHYGVGEEWGIIDAELERSDAEITGFLEQLATRGDYPFETALVHAANDNRWPTARFLEAVRHWNARHPETPMRTATVDDALDLLEAEVRERGIELAEFAGEWSDWWAHGHGSTAREVAVYRQARSFARAAQTQLALTLLRGDGAPQLAEVIGYRRGPVRRRGAAELEAALADVDEQLLLFGEHTWGSWETFSKPHSVFSHSHWNAKAGFAYGAYDLARDLAIEGFFRLAGSGEATDAAAEGSPAGESVALLVLNPSERERTEPIEAEVDGVRRVTAVARVPGFGAALVRVPEAPHERAGDSIETTRYRVTTDAARGGVGSLIELATGRELVDRENPHGLGALVLETIAAGGSTHPMLTHDPKDFSPAHPGPEFERAHAPLVGSPTVASGGGVTRIGWQTAVGTIRARHTLTVYDESEAIDVAVRLEKPEAFEPESVFVAFPFAVAGARFLLETAGAVYEAGREQLPDTSMDWYSIQHAVGVAGDDGSGVLWGSFDAPLVQLGGFHTGEWAAELELRDGSVNSWLMNNLHFTNFQASQHGTTDFRYRIVPRESVGREEVAAFGRGLLEPLQARAWRGPVLLDPLGGGRFASGLVVEPAERVFAELRPVGDGVRVRLRNATGERLEASVAFGAQRQTRELAPYGIADVTLATAPS